MQDDDGDLYEWKMPEPGRSPRVEDDVLGLGFGGTDELLAQLSDLFEGERPEWVDDELCVGIENRSS